MHTTEMVELHNVMYSITNIIIIITYTYYANIIHCIVFTIIHMY